MPRLAGIPILLALALVSCEKGGARDTVTPAGTGSRGATINPAEKGSTATAIDPATLNMDLVTSTGKPVIGPRDTLSAFSTIYEGKELPAAQAMILYRLGALEHMPGAAIIRRFDGSKEPASVIVEGPLAGALAGYMDKGTLMVRDQLAGQLTHRFSPRYPDKLVDDGHTVKYDGKTVTPMEAFAFLRAGWTKP